MKSDDNKLKAYKLINQYGNLMFEAGKHHGKDYPAERNKNLDHAAEVFLKVCKMVK